MIMSKERRLEKKLSSYAEGLSAEARKRYVDKIDLLNGYDPLLGVPAGSKFVVPPVDSCDLVPY